MSDASNPADPTLGPLTLHREDDSTNPGRQVFVLRDEAGNEVARSASFLPQDAPARNALDRLRETITGRGWEIVQRPNAAFGDAWWDFRFAPGPNAVDPAMLAEMVASPGTPPMRLGRRQRKPRMRQRRAVKLPSASILIFSCFSLFLLTVTIGFIIAVLLVLSN